MSHAIKTETEAEAISGRGRGHEIFTQMRSHLHFTPFELHTQPSKTKRDGEAGRRSMCLYVCVFPSVESSSSGGNMWLLSGCAANLKTLAVCVSVSMCEYVCKCG